MRGHRKVLSLTGPALARRMNEVPEARQRWSVGRGMSGEIRIPLERRCADQGALAIMRGEHALGELPGGALEPRLSRKLRGRKQTREQEQ